MVVFTTLLSLVQGPVRQHCALSANSAGCGCQNQWYHFGVGAPPILVYFSGDWDIHWGLRGFDPWPTRGGSFSLVLQPQKGCQASKRGTVSFRRNDLGSRRLYIQRAWGAFLEAGSALFEVGSKNNHEGNCHFWGLPLWHIPNCFLARGDLAFYNPLVPQPPERKAHIIGTA